jgi:hypothetical protein
LPQVAGTLAIATRLAGSDFFLMSCGPWQLVQVGATSSPLRLRARPWMLSANGVATSPAAMCPFAMTSWLP